MYFSQYYLDCLSQASYLVGDETTGQAVIVDPRRDIAEYLDDAQAHGLTIVGVINTHFHADFLSGHLELARETGAWIGYGAAADPEFEVRSLRDGERISLGDVTLEIMETPGHTPESISVLVFEHADDDTAYGVLTGDALFIGDVGRPDLLASVGVTADELGRMLYDSVQHKLMGLPDAVRVFPAHGAGSSCGKNLSTERQSTIGEQRAFNYACQPMSEADFLEVVTAGQPPRPPTSSTTRPSTSRDAACVTPTPSSPRSPTSRSTRLLPPARSLTTPATSRSSPPVTSGARSTCRGTAGWPRPSAACCTPEQKVVIIAPEGQEQEIATRFARIGFDNVLGYVADPEAYLLAHEDDVEHASRLTSTQVQAAIESDDVQIVDIRGAGELEVGMLPDARHIPLGELARRSDELDPSKPVVLYCAGGWRSSVGASLLRSQGFDDVSDIMGGYGAWALVHAVAS